jgi:HSP20 family protein
MSMIPYNNNFDWFKRFFDRSNAWMRRGRGPSGFFDIDPWQEFGDMEREMNDMFDQFNYISKNSPKELIREYETPEGEKVREVGPIVYGYSMTIGPDGKPKVTEFGNLKPSSKRGFGNIRGSSPSINIGPQITAEREPLADVSVTDKEVKVILEMPGVKKDNIKINAREGEVQVSTNDEQRKYHRTIELPEETDVDTAKSTYNNGVLEITFNKKKKEAKPKGKEIKID